MLLLSGCGAHPGPALPNSLVVSIKGAVQGGQQPVAGATIQLYAVNTAATGGMSSPLLGTAVTTDAGGGFSITGDYSCSQASMVYLTATGGNPGLTGNNKNLVMMTALGSCSSLTVSTNIAVNELTTVAAVQALAPYMSSASAVGSMAADLPLLDDAFTLASQLVNPGTGTSPGLHVPIGLTVPVDLIATLGDVIAPCINSTGGVAGDSTACGQLFELATPAGSEAPTNTIGALLNIVRNPTQNTTALFQLIQPSAPYQPALSISPQSFLVSINVPMPQRASLLAEYLLNEGFGTIADDTSGKGNTGTIVGSPIWDGSSDLNFLARDGQYVSLPASLNSLQTWQILFYNPAFSQSFASVAGAPLYPEQVGALSLLCGSSSEVPCFVSNSTFYGQSSNFYAFNTDKTEAAPFLQAGWHVVTYICGSAQGVAHILYDGAEVPSYITQGSNTCPVSNKGNYQLGGSSINGAGETTFVGRMAGMWAWSTPLTVAEAQSAGQTALNFLQAKGIPPTYLPLAPTTPLVLAGLDSRTAGAGDGNSSTKIWPTEITLTDSKYRVVNLAISGETVFDTVNQFNILYKLQAVPNTVPVIVVLWGGVNDANFQTAPQIAANLKSLVLQAKALGARVILATEISANGKDTNKNALNTILRGQAATWGADNLADLATDPVLGADGASTNTLYFGDGLHPNSIAEPHIVVVMQNAINELLGSTVSAPTRVSASNYQEVAGDDYVLLNGSVAQAVTLPDCTGYTLPRQIVTGPIAGSVSARTGQALNGSTVLVANTIATFSPVPGPLASSGCAWQRTR